MVETPFAWCLSPPKGNFPSVAVALPHKRQWIAHKWLDALKLRWSTRQAKTSAGLNMLQERHVTIFWQDWIMSVLFAAFANSAPVGQSSTGGDPDASEITGSTWPPFLTSQHLNIDISKSKVDLEPSEPANCPQLRCNLSLRARLDKPFQNLTQSPH